MDRGKRKRHKFHSNIFLGPLHGFSKLQVRIGGREPTSPSQAEQRRMSQGEHTLQGKQ